MKMPKRDERVKARNERNSVLVGARPVKVIKPRQRDPNALSVIYNRIPGWMHCADLYRYMVTHAKDGDVFVEVGAWKGRSAAFMAGQIADSEKAIRFFVVDHFKGSPHQADDPDVAAGQLKQVFLSNTRPLRQWITTIEAPSLEASKLFPDYGIDFLYLDASHEYEDVRSDLAAWLPKMKTGATIAGDDFSCEGVSRAVEETFGSHYSVFGRDKNRIWVARL